jgi:hypothetical protein
MTRWQPHATLGVQSDTVDTTKHGFALQQGKRSQLRSEANTLSRFLDHPLLIEKPLPHFSPL